MALMMSNDIGIDLGTASILVYIRERELYLRSRRWWLLTGKPIR